MPEPDAVERLSSANPLDSTERVDEIFGERVSVALLEAINERRGGMQTEPITELKPIPPKRGWRGPAVAITVAAVIVAVFAGILALTVTDRDPDVADDPPTTVVPEEAQADALEASRAFWQAVVDGDVDAALSMGDAASDGITDEAARNTIEFGSVFLAGEVLGCAAEDDLYFCDLSLSLPVFAADPEHRVHNRVEGGAVSRPMADLEPRLGDWATWARVVYPTEMAAACGLVNYPADAVTFSLAGYVNHPACAEFLAGLEVQYRTADTAARFLEAVGSGDAAAALPLALPPDDSSFSRALTRQGNNSVRFVAAFAWGSQVAGCRPAEAALTVVCTVQLTNPLWAAQPTQEITLVLVGQNRVTPMKLELLDERIEQLFLWAAATHAAETERECDATRYGPEEVVTSSPGAGFPLVFDEQCGTYLAGLVDEYVAST